MRPLPLPKAPWALWRGEKISLWAGTPPEAAPQPTNPGKLHIACPIVYRAGVALLISSLRILGAESKMDKLSSNILWGLGRESSAPVLAFQTSKTYTGAKIFRPYWRNLSVPNRSNHLEVRSLDEWLFYSSFPMALWAVGREDKGWSEGCNKSIVDNKTRIAQVRL